MRYKNNAGIWAFSAPHVKLACGAGLLLIVAAVLQVLSVCFRRMPVSGIDVITDFQQRSSYILTFSVSGFAIAGFILLIVAFLISLFMPDNIRMKYMIREKLFHPQYGNPLHLKEDVKVPRIKVKYSENNIACYEVCIFSTSCDVDTLKKTTPVINAALGGKFKGFAVVSVEQDTAGNYVTFVVEDVQQSKKVTCHSLKDLSARDKFKLRIAKRTFLDLRYSGSMLIAGKTRSGKTTGIICLLLQVLKLGRDKFGSLVTIIDPKKAELSTLSYVCSPDNAGNLSNCLQAIKKFLANMTERQEVLNRLSKKAGNAVRWWEAGMHPSILFIDEYVSICSMLPKKAPKDNPEYCLDNFIHLLKRIITMGASAGCFVIISIAEASVGEGGIPSMFKAAMGTKILFRPTLNEAKLMWENTDMLKSLPERTYGVGDAWFSSTDGIHDNVSFVPFPEIRFGEYAELERLLKEYYND